ncbi:MAG: ribosomal L7Ae/L30e/S12e/Gadd45 family protein [Clostridiales bacterium]
MNDQNEQLLYNEEQEQKVAGYLGIAQKAGKIAAGDAVAMAALNAGRVCLLVLAADAAEQVLQSFSQEASAKAVPIIYWRGKNDLGRIVGKSRRGAVAVLDCGLAAAILKTV